MQVQKLLSSFVSHAWSGKRNPPRRSSSFVMLTRKKKCWCKSSVHVGTEHWLQNYLQKNKEKRIYDGTLFDF